MSHWVARYPKKEHIGGVCLVYSERTGRARCFNGKIFGVSRNLHILISAHLLIFIVLFAKGRQEAQIQDDPIADTD